jgi:hypothetical protein
MIIHLCVKICTHCGLKYFCKTTQSNPYQYRGSGDRWLRHINKYGRKLVDTIELYSFDNQVEATKFALSFSEKHNIVESNEWANLVVENADNGPGGKKGVKHTEEQKQARSQRMTGKVRGPYKPKSPEQFEIVSKNISLSHCTKNPEYFRICKEETKQKISNSLKGQPSHTFKTLVTPHGRFPSLKEAKISLNHSGDWFYHRMKTQPTEYYYTK